MGRPRGSPCPPGIGRASPALLGAVRFLHTPMRGTHGDYNPDSSFELKFVGERNFFFFCSGEGARG